MPFCVQGDPDNYISLLSAAQIETLRLVFEHKNSKEIARIMDVSPHTVDERVRRALKKLNASNRIEAATILARNGVFDQVTPYQPLRYQLISLGDEAPADEAGVWGAVRSGGFSISVRHFLPRPSRPTGTG